MAFGSPQWMYSSGSYELEQSLKFEDGRSTYLSRIPASAGNQKTWTFSCWLKVGNTVDGAQGFFSASINADSNSAGSTIIYFNDGGQLKVRQVTSSSQEISVETGTNATFRDPSAWYHILVACDTTQATDTNRIKLYVNGEQLTNLSSPVYPSQNLDTYINSTENQMLGRYTHATNYMWDGYLAEVNLIDGQALTPADFGETGTYGEWKPKEYSGTYGTNGFYLPFKQDYTVEGFSTVTYKGTGASQYIGGTGFKPDLTWIRERATTSNHYWIDSIRGANNVIYSDLTNAEQDESGPGTTVTGFKNDGFTLGTSGGVNQSGNTNVAWNWDMGANTPTGFGCVKWTGNATARSIGDVGFSPDLIIERNRDDTTFNLVYDKIRGAGKALRTNSSNAESSYASDEITAFEPDGFRVSTGGDVNGNNQECIAWCWDMGGTSAANTSGSINSTVMANTTYGQSIVSYTGTGANATVGHGLSSAPEMIMVKRRSSSQSWFVYHDGIASDAETDALKLNDNGGAFDDNTAWNDTAPTNSVFSLGTGGSNGSSETHIAYCFHSVANYSKISSYTGNGSTTGPSVNLGFRPAFVMIKVADRTDGGNGAWWVFDSTRSFGTAIADVFLWNTTGAELHDNSNLAIDFLDNGFQLKSSYDEINVNGGTYVYMAFAGGVDSVSDFNTDGSLEARVKANPTYGQSIVSYTGASGAQTIGHGLSSAPEVIIVKNRSVTNEWRVYHAATPGGGSYNAEQYSFRLDTTAAEVDSTYWNDTAPTSSVFSVGDSQVVNSGHGNDYVAYCWHSVTGYSKFNRYSGTGSSGNSITTGFKPAFVMVKKSSGTDSWLIMDSTRNPVNPVTNTLAANSSGAENADTGGIPTNFTDTGFTLTGTGGDYNASGQTYIYMAFADNREYAYWLDQSGNNNDWTSNNLTESDISVDSPTNNFSTMNPLANANSSAGTHDSDSFTVSEGNLKTRTAGAADGRILNTIMPTTGKWYFEFVVTEVAESNRAAVSVGEYDSHLIGQEDQTGKHYMLALGAAGSDRLWYYGNEKDDYNYTTAVGDVWQFAFDITGNTHKIWIRQNAGNWFGTNSATFASGSPAQSQNKSSINTAFYVSHAGLSGSASSASTVVFNFGQDSSFAGNKTAQGNQDSNEIGDFYYTPPSGFLALCTSNLPDVDVVPSEHFNTVLYTGSNSSQNITGVGFQPDWTWLKNRNQSGGYPHIVYDAVRGVNKALLTNDTAAEADRTGDGISAFLSDGFTLPGGGWESDPSGTYVAWNWKANGSGSSNTDGSITSTVSANTDAGFSIVTYTGTGTNGSTIGHGLSKAPDIVIVKRRNTSSDWYANVKNIPSQSAGTDMVAVLNENYALDGYNVGQYYFADTAPNASTFTVQGVASVGANNDTHVAYCFHSVDGYSKVGTYNSNASTDGAFVYTGFKPALILAKSSSVSNTNWMLIDNARDTINPANKWLRANTSDVEFSPTNKGTGWDFTSNGFKVRNYNDDFNSPIGNTWIYIAFAETPFKYSNAR